MIKKNSLFLKGKLIMINFLNIRFFHIIIFFSIFYLYNTCKKEFINLRINKGTIRGYISYEAGIDKPVNVFKVSNFFTNFYFFRVFHLLNPQLMLYVLKN